MSTSYDNANAQYRDTVFRDYFNNPNRLLSLCNAILETNYKDESEIEINTLEGNFFSGQKNDVSCAIQDRFLVMVEHQSTVNPNMPFRFLSYVAQLFNNLVKAREKIYRNEKIKFPDPLFYVFYDGDSKEPLEQELRLSDLLQGTSNRLELIVKMYNINDGIGQPLLQKCDYLRDYSKLVGKVKQGLSEGLTRRQAITSAINWCIENGFMQNYLLQKKDEVFGMLDWQWNMDEAQAAWENKGRELGREEGITRGIESVAMNMLHNGKTVAEIHNDTKLPIKRIQELAKS